MGCNVRIEDVDGDALLFDRWAPLSLPLLSLVCSDLGLLLGLLTVELPRDGIIGFFLVAFYCCRLDVFGHND